METRKASGWKTCATVGCGVLLVLGVLLGVVVALNWDRIREGVRKATATVSELVDVQRAVAAHVRSSAVRVHVTDPGEAGSILRIEIGDPRFLTWRDPSDPAARDEALAIAVVARDALPPGSSCARYEVEYTSKLAVGVSVKFSQSFAFDAGELPARPAAEPAPR